MGLLKTILFLAESIFICNFSAELKTFNQIYMDTIMIIRDSVACCVRKTAEICQPCVKEAGTNCQDVTIVFIICVAIVVVAI